MSKRLKIIGVSALAALFAFAACEGPTGPAGGQGPTGPDGGQGPQGPAIVSSYLRVMTGEHFNGASASVVGNVLVWDALDYIPLDQLPNPAAYFTPMFIIENLAPEGGVDLTVNFASFHMNDAGDRTADGAASAFRLLNVDAEGYVLTIAGARFRVPAVTGPYINLDNLPRAAPVANAPAGSVGALEAAFFGAGVAGASVTLAPGATATIAMVPFNPSVSAAGTTQWLGTTHRRAYIDLTYSLAGGAQRVLTVPMLLLRQRPSVHPPVFVTGATDANTIVHGHTDSMNASGNLVWTVNTVAESPVHGVTVNHAGIAPEGFIIQSAFTGNPGTGVGGMPAIGTPQPANTLAPATPVLHTLNAYGAGTIGVPATVAGGTLPLRDLLMGSGGSGWHWVSVASQGGHTIPIYPNRVTELGQTRAISLNTPRLTPFFMFVPAPIATPTVTLSDDGIIAINPIIVDAALAWTSDQPFVFHIYRGDAISGIPRHIGTVTQNATVSQAQFDTEGPLTFDLLAPGVTDVNQPNQWGTHTSAWVAVGTGTGQVPEDERLWVGDNTITVRVTPATSGVNGMEATALYGQSAPALAGIFRYGR